MSYHVLFFLIALMVYHNNLIASDFIDPDEKFQMLSDRISESRVLSDPEHRLSDLAIDSLPFTIAHYDFSLFSHHRSDLLPKKPPTEFMKNLKKDYQKLMNRLEDHLLSAFDDQGSSFLYDLTNKSDLIYARFLIHKADLIVNQDKLLEATFRIERSIDDANSRLKKIQLQKICEIQTNHSLLQKKVELLDGSFWNDKARNFIIDKTLSCPAEAGLLKALHEQLAKDIHSHKVASSVISSGQVNGDQSMMDTGREVSLAAAEGIKSLGEEVPFLKTGIHIAVALGIQKIRNSQMNDNQTIYRSYSPSIYHESLASLESLVILKSLDICSLKLTPARVLTLSEGLARLWIKSLLNIPGGNAGQNLTISLAHLNQTPLSVANYQEHLAFRGEQSLKRMIISNDLSTRVFLKRSGLTNIFSSELLKKRKQSRCFCKF